MFHRSVFPTLAFAGLLLIVAPTSLHAGQPRTHDGFFLRLSVGPGIANTKVDQVPVDIDLDGVPDGFADFEFSGGDPIDLNFAIGGAIAPNLILHGTMFGWLMSDPEAEITGAVSGSGSIHGDIDMTAMGAGLTYYFMPINVYVSGSAGFGILELDSDDIGDAETDSGIAIDLTIGKEWWVGDSWGLGLAGGFGYHSLRDPDIDQNWSGTSFMVRFSATMN